MTVFGDNDACVARVNDSLFIDCSAGCLAHKIHSQPILPIILAKITSLEREELSKFST